MSEQNSNPNTTPAGTDPLFPRPWASAKAQSLFEAAIRHSQINKPEWPVYYENPATSVCQYVGSMCLIWAALLGPIYYFFKKTWLALAVSLVAYGSIRWAIISLIYSREISAETGNIVFLLAWLVLALPAKQALAISYKIQGWKQVTV